MTKGITSDAKHTGEGHSLRQEGLLHFALSAGSGTDVEPGEMISWKKETSDRIKIANAFYKHFILKE